MKNDILEYQKKLLLYAFLNKSSSLFWQISELSVKGHIDIEKANQALNTVISKYKTLNTIYCLDRKYNIDSKIKQNNEFLFIIVNEKIEFNKYSINPVNSDRVPAIFFIYTQKDENTFVFAFHQSIIDGYSIEIVIDDFLKEYTNLCTIKNKNSLTNRIRDFFCCNSRLVILNEKYNDESFRIELKNKYLIDYIKSNGLTLNIVLITIITNLLGEKFNIDVVFSERKDNKATLNKIGFNLKICTIETKNTKKLEFCCDEVINSLINPKNYEESDILIDIHYIPISKRLKNINKINLELLNYTLYENNNYKLTFNIWYDGKINFKLTYDKSHFSEKSIQSIRKQLTKILSEG